MSPNNLFIGVSAAGKLPTPSALGVLQNMSCMCIVDMVINLLRPEVLDLGALLTLISVS